MPKIVADPASAEGVSTLRGRVRHLLRLRRETANAAAPRIGVQQSTLSRIFAGHGARIEALSAIARYFHVDVGWLIEGRGKGPPDVSHRTLADVFASPSGESVRWETLLEELQPFGLSEHGALAWREWPATEPLYAAHGFFDFNLADPQSAATAEQREDLARALDEWRDACFAAATGWIERMLKVFAREAVAAQLDALRGRAMWGFHAQNAIGVALDTSNDPQAAEMLAASKASLRPRPVRALGERELLGKVKKPKLRASARGRT